MASNQQAIRDREKQERMEALIEKTQRLSESNLAMAEALYDIVQNIEAENTKRRETELNILESQTKILEAMQKLMVNDRGEDFE